MKAGIFEQSNTFTKLFIALFVILSSLLFVSVLSFVIAIPLFDIPINELMISISGFDESNVQLLKFFQITQSIGIFVIPPFIIGYLLEKKTSVFLSLNSTGLAWQYGLSILIMFSAMPLINYLAELNSSVSFPSFLSGVEEWMKEKEALAGKLTQLFLKTETVTDLLLNFFMIAIIPAIGEELVFRGVFQKLFTRMTKNVHWGIVISAFLFSAIHLQFYGFVPRMLLGMLFGYLLVWSGSIWLPIAAHLFNNGMAVLFYFFLSRNMVEKNIEEIGAMQGTRYLALLSTVIVGVLLWYFRNKSRKKTSKDV